MKIRELKFEIPPEDGGQLLQCGFAVTKKEIVRRTLDTSDGTTVYQTAAWGSVQGNFAPWEKTPTVAFGDWLPVAEDKEIL
jgi:hypothetical protein